MINVVLKINLFREKAKRLNKKASTHLFSSALYDLLLGEDQNIEEKNKLNVSSLVCCFISNRTFF